MDPPLSLESTIFRLFLCLCVSPLLFCRCFYFGIYGEQGRIPATPDCCPWPVLSSDESISDAFCMRMAWQEHPWADGCLHPYGSPGALSGTLGTIPRQAPP